MNIYMNDKLTSFKNIFDLLKEKGVCDWYYANDKNIGRKLSTVLDEWATNKETYYFISGKKYNFKLK